MITMTMTKAEIDVTEEIVPYIVPKYKDAQIIRNAMLVYLLFFRFLHRVILLIT